MAETMEEFADKVASQTLVFSHAERQARLARSECPECGESVEYLADVGTPGYGQYWECVGCGKTWVKVGPRWFDSAPELTEEDVR